MKEFLKELQELCKKHDAKASVLGNKNRISIYVKDEYLEVDSISKYAIHK